LVLTVYQSILLPTLHYICVHNFNQNLYNSAELVPQRMYVDCGRISLTLFLNVFSLQGKDASKLAGSWFQLLIFLFTKEYLPTSVLCFLLQILWWINVPTEMWRAPVHATTAVPWPRRSVGTLSPPRLGFDPRLAHVRLVVVTWTAVRFYPVSATCWVIYLPATLYNVSSWRRLNVHVPTLHGHTELFVEFIELTFKVIVTHWRLVRVSHDDLQQNVCKVCSLQGTGCPHCFIWQLNLDP
jgi:hypothetical protein